VAAVGKSCGGGKEEGCVDQGESEDVQTPPISPAVAVKRMGLEIVESEDVETPQRSPAVARKEIGLEDVETVVDVMTSRRRAV
jgi:hypothetical protein